MKAWKKPNVEAITLTDETRNDDGANSRVFMSVGEMIRRARHVAAISLRDAAVKAGTTPSYLAAIESGRTPRPRVKTLDRIAHVLGVSEDERERWMIAAARWPSDVEKIVWDRPSIMAKAVAMIRRAARDADEEGEQSVLHTPKACARAVK